MITTQEDTTLTEIDSLETASYCPIPHFVNRNFPDDIDQLDVCDAIRYARAMRQAVSDYPNAFGFIKGFDRDASAAAIDRVIKKPDFNTLICEEDGHIVGAVSYARPQPGTLELGYLFRLKRARSPAIGRLLLRDGLRMTQAKGDTRVVLSVLLHNSKALALYRSIGFCAEAGQVDDDPTSALNLELCGEENISRAVALLAKQIVAAHAAVVL